jgi:polysaccharide pyruvyl transferase WcaK-like protein
VGRYCSQSLIITRNEESIAILSKLGIRTELGTDTAWTFEPRGPEYGARALGQAGWDAERPVLIVCPINPFWWPVKPSLLKYAARKLFGAYAESQYRTIYFHRWGPQVVSAYQRYLAAIANAVDRFRKSHKAFVALVAMEQLDRDACMRISQLLGRVPVFTSDEYNMYELVSILRCSDLIVSSRYHGIVTSMPALVPSAGITMDERIRNLMRDRGHENLLLEVDDPDLTEREAIADAIGRSVVKNLKLMARMGVYFEEHLERCYPDFPTRTGIYSWEDYLPPMSASLRKLIERYE